MSEIRDLDLRFDRQAQRVISSRVFARDENEWYVEPSWCSARLFQCEPFIGDIWDPCCGGGRIVHAARESGYRASGSDVADRGFGGVWVADFLQIEPLGNVNSIVCNPPFRLMEAFARHAFSLRTTVKLAMIFPTARLHAAHWIAALPLRRVWLMTPRPSMPPGTYIAAGGKVGGGKVDYCWLVFERGYDGHPEMRWLRRDGGDHAGP